jgi:hypothetical protein
MTTLVKITLAFIMAILLSSCVFDVNFGEGKKGNGSVTEETREITEDFTLVSASEGLEVYVTQAGEFSITVEGDENIIDLIGTDIKDGELRVHALQNIGRATKKVFVSLPEITALESSSGADLIVQNAIEAEQIKLSASSGADIKVELTADEVRADASSGSDIRVSGETNNLFASASSGANVQAGELLSKICEADASSGGNVSVNVSESLVADASSGGDVSYTGEASVQKKNSVSGSVHKY